MSNKAPHAWIITEDHLAAVNPYLVPATGGYGPRPGTRRRDADRAARNGQHFRVVNDSGDVYVSGRVWPPCDGSDNLETFNFSTVNGDFGVDPTWGFTTVEVLLESGDWYVLP